MLTTIVTIFHVIVCIFLILVVLLQQGNAADWSGAFGGGGSRLRGARGRYAAEPGDDSGRDHFHDYVDDTDDSDFETR